MRYIIPWLIILISIFFIKYSERKKDKYLVYALVFGSLLGGALSFILKYVGKVKVDIGLYILIFYFVFGLLEILLNKIFIENKKRK